MKTENFNTDSSRGLSRSPQRLLSFAIQHSPLYNTKRDGRAYRRQRTAEAREKSSRR